MQTDTGPPSNRGETWQAAWQDAEGDLASRRHGAARAGYERVLALQPGHPGALLRLSTIATAQGRYRDAVAALVALADDPPADPDLLLMLASSLHRLGESAAALACLHHPCFDDVRDPMVLGRAAQAAIQLEDLGRAQVLLDASARIAGPHPGALYAAATISLFEGRLGEAQDLLERCLALAPGHAQAHWSLSRLQRQTPQDNHATRLRGQLATQREPRERVYLAFALFKELDDLGDTDGAWDALMQGCADKRGLLAAGASTSGAAREEAEAFEALQNLWADRGLQENATGQAPVAPSGSMATSTPTPIFIVGMPRTGTTLLERILSGTGRVADAGELDDIPLQLRWLADCFSRSFCDARVFGAARARGAPALLGERYLAHAGWRARGHVWFTDKLPMNFLHLGFIAEALPRAPLLHMVRNPMDTCFSNLKELFTDAYPYSYSLESLAAHYDRYRRLMAHWHRCFPGRILDVPYEGLVAEPAYWARRILAHCGIGWDPRCLEVAAGAGTVTTASAVQVREPIHSRSVEAWRRYSGPLEPLHRQLQEMGWIEGAQGRSG